MKAHTEIGERVSKKKKKNRIPTKQGYSTNSLSL